MSPSYAIFFEASHWLTGHMTRSQASHWSLARSSSVTNDTAPSSFLVTPYGRPYPAENTPCVIKLDPSECPLETYSLPSGEPCFYNSYLLPLVAGTFNFFLYQLFSMAHFLREVYQASLKISKW